MSDHDITAPDLDEDRRNAADFSTNLHHDGAQSSLDIAFQYPISLIVNALGVPPKFMRDKAKAHDVLTGALIGSARHAIRQVEADVDILIAAGGEAGGHCGEISTMVLIPEVARALKAINVETLFWPLVESQRENKWQRPWPWGRQALGVDRFG